MVRNLLEKGLSSRMHHAPVRRWDMTVEERRAPTRRESHVKSLTSLGGSSCI